MPIILSFLTLLAWVVLVFDILWLAATFAVWYSETGVETIIRQMTGASYRPVRRAMPGIVAALWLLAYYTNN